MHLDHPAVRGILPWGQFREPVPASALAGFGLHFGGGVSGVGVDADGHLGLSSRSFLGHGLRRRSGGGGTRGAGEGVGTVATPFATPFATAFPTAFRSAFTATAAAAAIRRRVWVRRARIRSSLLIRRRGAPTCTGSARSESVRS